MQVRGGKGKGKARPPRGSKHAAATGVKITALTPSKPAAVAAPHAPVSKRLPAQARVRAQPAVKPVRANGRAGMVGSWMAGWRPRPRLWLAAKLTAGAASLAIAFLATAIAYTLSTMPPLESTAVKSKERGPAVVAADGTLLTRKAHAQRYVKLERLPTHLIDAVLATEDRRFYRHWGVDPWGLIRASAVNVWSGRTVQGGSTITQQLAKNLFLEPERTFARKRDELLYALALEARFTKDEILELYLNRVYLGGGAYGVAAASDLYFGVPPEQLTLAQSAIMAGLLKAPSRYAPTNSPALAKARGHTVLAAMADAEIIAPALAELTKREPVGLVQESGTAGEPTAGYATDWVADLLPQLVKGSTEGVRVETTLDLGLQLQAESIVRRVLERDGQKLGASEAAVVVLDNDGAVRALVGGRSYARSQFNRAIKARRQPGSAFKPFVFLAAVEAGMTPDSVLIDAPFTVAGWTPRNYNGEYRGAVTARDALALSINTVAVRMFQTAGRDGVVNTARRLGITSPLVDDASLALGTSEVTPLELAGAYVPFGNGGQAVTPHLVAAVTGADGKPLWSYQPPAPRNVIAPEALTAMTDMMTETIETGTGKAAAIPGVPAAGKTGTTQDSRDAWFAGVTAHYTAVVWVGNDDGSPMNKVTGGTLPAKIWRDVMKAAHTGLESHPLPGSHIATTTSSLDLSGLLRSLSAP
jgi:penicillin-binding protein 1A